MLGADLCQRRWLLNENANDIAFDRYAIDSHVSMTIESIRGTEYPQAQEFAANNVLRPPSEREILDRFALVALR